MVIYVSEKGVFP